MDKFVGPKKCRPKLKKSIIKTSSAKKKKIYIYIYKDDIKRKKRYTDRAFASREKKRKKRKKRGESK